MPQLPTRPPLTGRINAQNPLARGLVFAWAPGFSLQDFTTGKPITLASVGSTTPNGSINIGRATRDRYTINTPISGGGSVSFLAVSEQYTANDGISFGAMNLGGSNEHIKFSGAMYVGPFGTSRYVSAATNPEPLTDPYTYSGSIRSGVTNGTKIWCNSRLLFTGTVTTSPPAQLGLLRHSSNSATSAPLDEGYLWLIWNRALSDEEMRRAQENPWQVLETTKLATSWLPMFSVGGANIQAGLTDTGTAGDAVASDLVARQLGGFTFLFSGLLRPGTSTLTTSELADALAAADTVASQVTLLGALSDALAAGEVVLVNGTFQAAASDSAAASDTVASASVFVSLLDESATAGDTVTGGVALISLVSDSAAAADTVVSSSAYASAIADSVSATDAVSAAATLLGALAETITAADAASAAAQLQAQIAEALAAADLPIAVLSGLGTITESVVLADGASAIATLSVTLSDAVATGDAITAPSAATYQINVSVAWAAPAGARTWAAPSRSRTWAAPSTPRVWH